MENNRPSVTSLCLLLASIAISGRIQAAVASVDKGSIASRDYYGDTFHLATERCDVESCSNNNRREATVVPGHRQGQPCLCQCKSIYKTYRDDTGECVNNIRECLHASFIRDGSKEDSVPFVFLPNIGQLLHPSAPISIPGIQDGRIRCDVTLTSYFAPNGIVVVSNSTEGFQPFSFFKDNNRMYLKWNGDEDEMKRLISRLVKVLLHCKSVNDDGGGEEVRPCVTFRVAGNSMFVAPATISGSESGGGKPNNYVIIGLAVGLLGLIYVVALFIFLTVRKRRLQVRRMAKLEAQVKEMKDSNDCEHQYDTVEEVAAEDVTNQPESLSSSASKRDEDGIAKAVSQYYSKEPFQESAPEECVPIVETGDEQCLRQHEGGQNPNRPRKRLYFNPDFFDRHLLINPPPEAQEFVQKIREMIGIAKTRLRQYRYKPKLTVVPEADYFYHDPSEFNDPFDDFAVFVERPSETATRDVEEKSPKREKKEIPTRDVEETAGEPDVESNDFENRRQQPADIAMKGSNVKIKKLCVPPPPPPVVKMADDGMSQFDMFRRDLEIKINKMNMTRQQNNETQEKSNERVKEWLEDQKVMCDGEKETAEATAKPKPRIRRSKGFKSSRQNFLRDLIRNDRINEDGEELVPCVAVDDDGEELVPSVAVHDDDDDEPYSCDNYDANVVKLDLRYGDDDPVPKTTIRVEGRSSVTCDLPDVPSSNVGRTVITVPSQSDNLSVTINDDKCRPRDESSRTMSYYDKQASSTLDVNGNLPEDVNLSSDSAIDDTSFPSSPVDSNSEKSVDDKECLDVKGAVKSDGSSRTIGDPLPNDDGADKLYIAQGHHPVPYRKNTKPPKPPRKLAVRRGTTAEGTSSGDLVQNPANVIPGGHPLDVKIDVEEPSGRSLGNVGENCRRLSRRRPVKSRNEHRKGKVRSRNGANDDDDHSSDEEYFRSSKRTGSENKALGLSVVDWQLSDDDDDDEESLRVKIDSLSDQREMKKFERQLMVIAQEKLLNRFAQNMNGSQKKSNRDVIAAVHGKRRHNKHGGDVDRMKIDALLNGHLQADETIL